MRDKLPKVSVCVVTYNQEKYIRQCLQSIVDQKTNFDFEVIVGDDCSNDETSAIVMEFADRHQGLVKPILHKKNIGATRNFFSVHGAAVGEYIAHIDGDDYTLQGKLQAQADVLDSFSNVALSVHAVAIDGTDRIIGNEKVLPEFGAINDLLFFGTYFVNSSVMYRKVNQLRYNGVDLVDYYCHIEHASKGNIHLIKKPLGVYRWHPQGMSKNKNNRDEIEQWYESAFDRALELGASPELVMKARLKHRMSGAIQRYLSGDIEGYQRKILITNNEIYWASKKHIVLHLTRRFPTLIGIYAHLRGLR